MMTDFERYVPEAWHREGLLIAGKQQPPVPTTEKRTSAWRISVSSQGLIAGLLGVSLFVGTATATNLPRMSAGVEVTNPEAKEADAPLSPLREINRSFNELYSSFRRGERLIATEEIRDLAKRAVQSQTEDVDVESWARALANDVKDADD
jgi:hypothetical protein